MSIASAIQAKQQQVVNSYTAVSNKGGTLPATQNLTNLATAISSIPTGGTPTLITKSITANGTYNASSDNADGYSSVTVNVSASKYGATIDCLLGDLNANNVLQAPTENFDLSFPTVTDLANYALYYKFIRTKVKSVSFPELTTISGDSAANQTFSSDTALTSISFPELTTISGNNGFSYTFSSDTALTSVSFPKLTTISGISGAQYVFYNCISLTSISFPELTTISGSFGFSYAFSFDSGLTSASFPKLATVTGSYALQNTFAYCNNLQSLSFPALTTTSFGSNVNQLSGMMSGTGTSKTHTIHFPSNMQSTISGLTGYPLFGGTSGYVTLSFDLPATS